MPQRIYQQKHSGQDIIKVRLQHTAPGDQVSPVLQRIAETIDKTKLYSFSNPRLGTNPKEAENPGRAVYLGVDVTTLLRMFEYLSSAQQAA